MPLRAKHYILDNLTGVRTKKQDIWAKDKIYLTNVYIRNEQSRVQGYGERMWKRIKFIRIIITHIFLKFILATVSINPFFNKTFFAGPDFNFLIFLRRFFFHPKPFDVPALTAELAEPLRFLSSSVQFTFLSLAAFDLNFETDVSFSEQTSVKVRLPTLYSFLFFCFCFLLRSSSAKGCRCVVTITKIQKGCRYC